MSGLCYKVAEKLTAPFGDYGQRFTKYFPTEAELEVQKSTPVKGPCFSVLVPAYETPEPYFCQLVDSLLAQTYENWQLCIGDAGSSDTLLCLLREHYPTERRISYEKLEENGGISENTNATLQLAVGEYIALLDHDDVLAPNALYEMAREIEKTGARVLYSDEDKLIGDGQGYCDPHFKLDYNEELLLGNNYICHFLVVERELFTRVGGLHKEFDGAQDYDLVLRLSEVVGSFAHVPKILYHWRIHPASTAGNTASKDYAYEAGKRALEAHFQRIGQDAKVERLPDPGFYRTTYPVPWGVTVALRVWKEEKPSKTWFLKVYAERVRKPLQERNLEKIKMQLIRELEEAGVQVLPETESASADFTFHIPSDTKGMAAGSALRLLSSCDRRGVLSVGGVSYRKKNLISGKRVVQCGFRRKGYGNKNCPELWDGFTKDEAPLQQEGFGKSDRSRKMDNSQKPAPLVSCFTGLPAGFRGYFHRATLSSRVDGLWEPWSVTDNRKTAGSLVVEPGARLYL